MFIHAKLPLLLATALGLLTLPCCDDVNRSDSYVISPGLQESALAFPAGISRQSGPASPRIRSTLASLTSDAVSEGEYGGVIRALARPASDRTGQFTGVDAVHVDDLVDRINEVWKTTYGLEFRIDADTAFGPPVWIIEGEVTDPAVASLNWPVAATDNAEAIQSDQTLQTGRAVALVRLPGIKGAPDLTISMVRTAPDTWQVDIPADRSGEQIYRDLSAQLAWLGHHPLPSDVNDGYRLVAYHILAGLYGVHSTAQ